MIGDGGLLLGDGSWELRIYVTDLKVERTLRVKGDLHLGGVMLKLVEDLDVAIDWSDHGLWWPKKNIWLSRPRTTLNQYGVQADAALHFTPMHKTLRIQLPDLRYMDARVDYSVKCFSAIVKLCKDLGIRHAEELSFCRPLTTEHLKRNYRYPGVSPRQRSKDTMGPIVQTNNGPANISGGGEAGHNRNGWSTEPRGGSPARNNTNAHTNGHNNHISTPTTAMNKPSTPDSSFQAYGEPSSLPSLASSPSTPSAEARQSLLRPKSKLERARLNGGWLDSSLSLFQQDVREFDRLQLRFKFFTYYDLNPTLDASRINQIYEQARWAILAEEIDCSEEEMMMFAALQLQVTLQAYSNGTSGGGGGGAFGGGPNPAATTPKSRTSHDEDIDSALDDLQRQLEGTTGLGSPGSNITQVPELSDYLKFMKPKRFTLKTFKRYYFVFKDTRLSAYKSREEKFAEPMFSINLKGCELTPDVNLAQAKYGIRLEVPNPEGMTEYWIRCDSESQYAKWMAGCRLASRGKTMADSSYEAEVKQILDFLSMQHPAPGPAISPSQVDVNPDDYVAPRFLRKLKGRGQIVQRILEAHANVRNLTNVESKISFVKAWQALPEYGVSMFVVKFVGSKKEELLGVAPNRLMRMDMAGDHLKTWRFNTMKSWNVNWEIKQVQVQFEEEDVKFSCLSADCKNVHEFIGGYIFLSMRSKDQNQTLNEELFHKLTGGWARNSNTEVY